MSGVWRVAVLLGLAFVVIGCGVTQHNLIAHRAMHWFDPGLVGGPQYAAFADILANNQGSFQNGAAFPDWGYACFHSDQSEAAHWPPFTLHSARYLRENCGMQVGNWTTDCQQLGAFLFGVVAHQIADIPWHDLTATYPSRQGFIQEMANIEFDGDFGTAHTIADTGAEFVIAREFDLSFIIAEWHLPVDALLAIYDSMGYPLEAFTLEACNVLLYAEVHAIKYFGDLLYPYASRRSVFLTDQQLNYWSGGMDANTALVVDCWQDYLEYWLSPADAPPLTYPICLVQRPIFDDDDGSDFSPFRDHPFIREMAEFMVDEGYVKAVNDGSGVAQLIADDSAAPFLREEALRRMVLSENVDIDDIELEDSPAIAGLDFDTWTAASDYSYFGHSLASNDVDGDGMADVLVGAPGYGEPGSPQLGAVYVIPGGTNNNSSEPKLLVVGEGPMARFGWAVASVDFNADGVNDLVVGSPMSTASELTYKGEISVFFGSASGGYSSTADVAIRTTTNYTNLGYTLLAADVNNDGADDLVIGCPFAGSGTGSYTQAGRVFVFYSSATLTTGTTLDADNDSNIVLEGPGAASWYGYALDTVKVNNDTLLLVGAPNHEGEDASTGMLLAYSASAIASTGGGLDVPAIFTISGSTKWDMVGFSFATGAFGSSNNALAFGLPNRAERGWQHKFMGAAAVVDMTTLASSYDVDDLDFLIYEEGDQEYARFGWAVGLAPNAAGTPLLWVTQPRRSTDAGKESGVAYAFTSSSTVQQITSTAKLARMGESLLFSDVDRSGTVDVILGVPRFNSTLTGAVAIFSQ
mmetsp:Transcript_17099/g.66590  ORF Transcript_17099/g.66590 Transcript_17099/m.66590 type:complete len:807 (+) Transcript_17099:26-2446(+)